MVAVAFDASVRVDVTSQQLPGAELVTDVPVTATPAASPTIAASPATMGMGEEVRFEAARREAARKNMPDGADGGHTLGAYVVASRQPTYWGVGCAPSVDAASTHTVTLTGREAGSAEPADERSHVAFVTTRLTSFEGCMYVTVERTEPLGVVQVVVSWGGEPPTTWLAEKVRGSKGSRARVRPPMATARQQPGASDGEPHVPHDHIDVEPSQTSSSLGRLSSATPRTPFPRRGT
jgi:hypothetical protein